jgi:hypothetical protein
VIATIQGFEQEILPIAAKMYDWLASEVQSGGIGCPTVIKKEDITRFYTRDAELQLVVRPEFW